MLGGYGSCGRPLCCTTWLQTFEPVSIKMAKQQDLSLNPSKLSGLCGRLKCCLRYELPNAKGELRGGCGDEGGCGNPTGCGTGELRKRRRLQLRTGEPPMTRPRIAITVGDPAGIGPEIAARGRGRSAGARRAASRSSTPARRPTPSSPGALSAAAGRAAYDVIVRAVRRRAGRPRRRDRHRADQQGGVRARRPAVEGPHRPARPPHGQPARRDDVRCAGPAGGARHRAHPARGRAARADASELIAAHDPPGRARAARLRLRAAADRGGRRSTRTPASTA